MPNKTSSITYETFLKSTEVHKTWSEILPEGHHLVSADIRALEESCPEDIGFRYVNMYENGLLIGVMYLQLLTFNHRHYDHQLLDRPVIGLFKKLIMKQSTEVLICGNLFRVDFQGFYFIEEARKSLIFNCLLEYRKTIDSGSGISGILVKDCSREFEQIQFGCHSFRSFTQDLTMELNIRPQWHTFQDYTNDLSRKYRQRAVKIQSAAKDIQRIDLSLDDLIRHQDNIEALYRNILRKQNLALGIINSAYFIRMKSLLNDDFKVFAYQLDGRILAFSSHIYYPQRQCMEIHYIGLDYEANSQYQLYFNILFDGIRTAIDKGMQLVEMGRTAREAKANAGAHPVENYNYIWVKAGFPRLIVNFLTRSFESGIGEDWHKRHPFKSVQHTQEVQG